SAVDAIRSAMKATALGTLTAALCASVAYGSLAATDFRGFRQFGVVGGLGMLLCWVASYTLLPALLVLAERWAPLPSDQGSWQNRMRGLYGRPFAYLASRVPRLCLAFGALTFTGALVLAVRYAARDPLEYDLTHVRNDAPDANSSRQVARRINNVVNRATRDGRALVADRLDQVAPLIAELERRRDAAPADRKPFERVLSVFDLLPREQPEKIALVSQIMDLVQRARRRGTISDEEWQKLAPELPASLKPLTIADLPSDVAWPFEEADGTRGRVVYLVPTAGRSVNDAHYLMQWADAFREVRLQSGEVIRGSGDPVIFADMLLSVREDAPKALGLALSGTFLVIVLAFRSRRSALLAFGSLVLSLVWLVAFLALVEMRINFLNFVALPISVGVGADYAVNVMRRYELERGQRLGRVLVETGGALVLCSLTTLLGYGALSFSINGAVRSFGIAAAAGEICMLLAAVLVLPAALVAGQSSSARRSRHANRAQYLSGRGLYQQPVSAAERLASDG
ncbi:MAG TPA: MMPL family transporter, partial [Polyangiaceae bacterium]|nr:MMPL family transporter [Polyangiaceae bacterium]